MAYIDDLVAKKKAEEAAKERATTTTQFGTQLRGMTMDQLVGVQNRQAPQSGYTRVGDVSTGTGAQVDPRMQGQLRYRQLGVADRLEGIASGQMAGAGELAAQRQGQRAAAQQVGFARMQRGADAATAARGAVRNAGNIGLATAGQAQQAALQDQTAANQTLTGLLQGARGQDIDMAGQNAQLKQQMNLANMDAQNQRVFQQAGLDQATSLANMQSRLQTMGMNDQAAIAYLAQLYGVDVAEMNARLQLELGKMAQPKGGSMFGDLMTVGGTMLATKFGGPAAGAAYAQSRQ